MIKKHLKSRRKQFEDLDLSRFHILGYEELLKVNGGSSEDSDDSDDSDNSDSSDSSDSGSSDDSSSSDSGSETASDSSSETDSSDDSDSGSSGGGYDGDDGDNNASSSDGASAGSESGGHEVENSNAGVAGAEVGDTITRDDGTEITLTQGDIDWAQDYCNEHGISYGNNNDRPADNTSQPAVGNPDTPSSPSGNNGSPGGNGNTPGNGDGGDSDSNTGTPAGSDSGHGHSAGGQASGNGGAASNGNTAGSGKTSGDNAKSSSADNSRTASNSHSEKNGNGILGTISNLFSGVKDWVSDVFGVKEKSVNGEKAIIEPEQKIETQSRFILNIEPIKDKYGNFLGYGYEAEERKNALEKAPQLNVSLYGSVNVGLFQGNLGGKVTSDYGGQSASSIRGVDTGIYVPGVGLNATIGCSFPENEGSQSHSIGLNVFGFCGDITFSEKGISEFNIGLSSNTGYKGEIDVSDFGIGYSLIK